MMWIHHIGLMPTFSFLYVFSMYIFQVKLFLSFYFLLSGWSNCIYHLLDSEVCYYTKYCQGKIKWTISFQLQGWERPSNRAILIANPEAETEAAGTLTQPCTGSKWRWILLLVPQFQEGKRTQFGNKKKKGNICIALWIY